MTKFLAMLTGSYGYLGAAALMASDEPIGIIELTDNLADVEKPPELPAGIYTGEVQDVQVLTSAKGNQYFAIKFVIPTSEIAADIAENFEDGAVLYWNRQIVPDGKDRRSLFNLRKLIEAFGLSSATTSIDPNEWMGCQASLRVTMGKWQGEDRAEIKSIEAAEAAPAAPAAAKAAKAASGKGKTRR